MSEATLLVLCSRNRGRDGSLIDLLCSRNARPEKALVGRAQWKINQPPSLKRKRASFEGSFIVSLDGRNGNELSCPVQCMSTHTPVY